MNRPLLHFFENGLPLASLDDGEFKDYSIRKKTEDYIAETYLLSQCDSLYACISTGVQVAYIINGGKYKNMLIDEKGLWTKEDLKIER